MELESRTANIAIQKILERSEEGLVECGDRSVEAVFVSASRLIIRFDEFVAPPEEGGEDGWLEEQLGASVSHEKIRVRTLFSSLKVDGLNLLAKRAQVRDRRLKKKATYLGFYITLDCAKADDARALLKSFLNLGRCRIPLAYEELGTEFSNLNGVAEGAVKLDQAYLREIGADYANLFPGGDGAGLRFVDVERGWRLEHADLIDAGITVVSGEPSPFPDDRVHGTCVLGIVTAMDNGKDVVGIVPGLASARVVAVQRTQDIDSIADAILSGITELRYGDVLLIEMEIDNGKSGFRPVEVQRAAFDAIRLATALGIVVIQPAGNGGKRLERGDQGNLDLAPIKERDKERFRLQRGHRDFLDSGAIIVGASRKAIPHSRHPSSNFGSRIDCYAWGEGIATTVDASQRLTTFPDIPKPDRLWGGLLTTAGPMNSAPRLLHLDNGGPLRLPDGVKLFDGTSGASAIIAGVALSVQGLAHAHLGFRFSPWQLRLILSDPAYGTPSENAEAFPIGVMPNLRTILKEVFRLPDFAAPEDDLEPASRKGAVQGELLQPDEPSTEKKGHLLLPFVVSGSDQKQKELWIEVIARLPRRARIWLEMPPALADLEGIWGGPEVNSLNKKNVYAPVNPHGRHPFREATLKEGQREKLRLVILFPLDLPEGTSYPIAVRLLHDLKKREEVGRITWRVGP